MTVQPRSIAAQQNRLTAYEVALIVDGKTVEVFAYTEKKTKSALIKITFANGPKVAAHLTEEELDSEWNYSAAKGVVFSDKVRVAFTGRTERDAAQSLNKLN